jgi:hypothetical protein
VRFANVGPNAKATGDQVLPVWSDLLFRLAVATAWVGSLEAAVAFWWADPLVSAP